MKIVAFSIMGPQIIAPVKIFSANCTFKIHFNFSVGGFHMDFHVVAGFKLNAASFTFMLLSLLHIAARFL